VQFAGFVPAGDRRAADLTAAREIIALTAPEPLRPPAEPASRA